LSSEVSEALQTYNAGEGKRGTVDELMAELAHKG